MAKTESNTAPAFLFPKGDFNVINKETAEVSQIPFKIITKMDYNPQDNFFRVRIDYVIVFAFDFNSNVIKEIV